MDNLLEDAKLNDNTKLPPKMKMLLIINYVVIVLCFFINICASIYFFNVNNTEDVFEDNILKVVEIKVTDDEQTFGHATGFFIDSSGKILTNKHVVFNSETNENYKSIYVRLATQEDYTRAEVIKISDTDDLAVIKVDFKNTKYFRLASSVNNGEGIFTIGNPNGFGLSFSSGVVSINSRNVIYNGKTINAIQTSLVINEGNSGGPVFNKDGKIVGIVSFRLKDKDGNIIQGCCFAIPVEKIKSFINE